MHANTAALAAIIRNGDVHLSNPTIHIPLSYASATFMQVSECRFSCSDHSLCPNVVSFHIEGDIRNKGHDASIVLNSRPLSCLRMQLVPFGPYSVTEKDFLSLPLMRYRSLVTQLESPYDRWRVITQLCFTEIGPSLSHFQSIGRYVCIRNARANPVANLNRFQKLYFLTFLRFKPSKPFISMHSTNEIGQIRIDM